MTKIRIKETDSGYEIRVKQSKQPAFTFSVTEKEMEKLKTEAMQAWWRKKKVYESELRKPTYNPEPVINFNIESLNPELDLIENLCRPKGWANRMLGTLDEIEFRP